ncbi:universal stress protein [Schaalia sp. 19OD2882]|uniref:universal stress protein n=1 Tax=Schaalia sp. 19OD2882 TaxID=2794089 RepID=UPI001C1F150A|nr:universal stress protein [Schaalia sp. 19OD2882]QWW18871.1 universal stress protein [Schaalia sp. 19OD2882]
MSILLCHHGNVASAPALDAAISAVRVQGGPLLVLDCMEEGSEAGEHLWRRLETVDIPFEVVPLRVGQDPASAVLETAAERGCALVVLALAQRGAGGATVGPQASRILLECPVPVLTTTAPQEG